MLFEKKMVGGILREFPRDQLQLSGMIFEKLTYPIYFNEVLEDYDWLPTSFYKIYDSPEGKIYIMLKDADGKYQEYLENIRN